jgi:hypothetical protein
MLSRAMLGSMLVVLAACGSDPDVVDGGNPFGNAAGDGDSSGGGGSGSGSDGNAGDGSGNPGGGPLGEPLLPVFPGAGTSDAADPLPNGMLCDAVPLEPSPIPEAIQDCFFDKNDPTHLAATLEQVLECAEETDTDTVHIRLTFHPWFVDNTYGANAIGWGADDAPMMAEEPPMPGDEPMMMPKPRKGMGGHTFNDLVGSDHAEILFRDANGELVMQFKLDYLTADAASPSGYASLGVTGGEGKMIVGDAAHVVKWMTSQDRNLNERGYDSYTVDSPATDADYTPNTSTPEWDYRVVYEAWISLEAFGDGGFGGAEIEFVHASPSKAESNTIEVEPGECPPPPCPGTDPDVVCGENPPDEDPPDEDPPPPDAGVCSLDPDAPCGDAGLPPPEEGPDCEMFPDQCMVD